MSMKNLNTEKTDRIYNTFLESLSNKSSIILETEKEDEKELTPDEVEQERKLMKQSIEQREKEGKK